MDALRARKRRLDHRAGFLIERVGQQVSLEIVEVFERLVAADHEAVLVDLELDEPGQRYEPDMGRGARVAHRGVRCSHRVGDRARGAALRVVRCVPEGESTRLVTVLAYDADNTLAVGRSAPVKHRYPALTPACAQAHLFEREVWEQHSLVPEGHPWLKPVVSGAPSCAPAVAVTSCVPVCPTQALTRPPGSPVSLDLGKCLFCAACVEACPAHAITQTNDHRMAVRRRADVVLGKPGEEELRLANVLDKKLRKLFGRSLRLRQVSAGGCNACEADPNVLGTIGWDLGRFGIQFVASPRHANGLLITGPVTRNMRLLGRLEKNPAASANHEPGLKRLLTVGQVACLYYALSRD